MARPVTLFTGQWADLPVEDLAAKCAGWGFDGLELACWGDHFDVAEATRDSGYAAGRRELLERHGLGCWAIGNHLVGQCVADPIDERHKGVLSPEIWGDGDPEGVRQRAAEAMKDTARAAAQLGVDVVTGFTGSPTWHMLYSFPPNDFDAIERGYRSSPSAGGRSSTCSRPRACASRSRCTRPRSPTTSSRRARRSPRSATGRASASTSTRATSSTSSWTRRRSSPSSATKIFHAHIKDSVRRLDGRSSILGGHLNFGEPGRGWDFVSPGHGDVDFESMIRALNRIGYNGPLSIEWEDSGMDRDWGAPDALAFVRRTDFAPSSVAFDAAFAKES